MSVIIHPIKGISAKPGSVAGIQVHEEFEDGIG